MAVIICTDRISGRWYTILPTRDSQFSVFYSDLTSWNRVKKARAYDDPADAVQELVRFWRKSTSRKWGEVESIDDAIAAPSLGIPEVADYIPPEAMAVWERKKNEQEMR